MWRSIFVVFAKEAVDNIRDRRSFLSALVYPLLGPLLLGGMISAVSGVVSDNPERIVTIPVAGAEGAPHLMKYLDQRGIRVAAAPANVTAAVQEGSVDSVLVIAPNHRQRFEAEKPAGVRLIVDSSRLPGLLSVSRMLKILGDYNRHVGRQRLARKGIDARLAQPLAIKSVNVASRANLTDFFLFMVPPFVIFAVFLGGVYLAIDTTSGERERGTLEPLLINPVARWGLMLGKFLAALLFTIVAVVVQLAAFKLTFLWVAGAESNFFRALDFGAMAMILTLALPLMALAVSLQVVIAAITRSYKEAQTYLGLLPLVPAIPGMVLIFAPVKSQLWMMSIPAFSQTLLFGQALRDEAVSWAGAATSAGVTGALALGLLYVAARLYEREELVFDRR